MLTLEQIKSKSVNKLVGLNPVVKKKAEQLIELAYNQGIAIIITQGYRSIEEQNELYAQGRTKPGNIVTNAKGGHSFHNYGVAIDYALLSDDGKTVLWTVNDKWRKVANIGKSLGFAWGGDWTSFKDYPHLEMTFGLSISDYLAGKRPVVKEDEDILELSNYQWDTLVTTITSMVNNKIITDKTWIDKANNKTLTQSELAWLALIVANRK